MTRSEPLLLALWLTACPVGFGITIEQPPPPPPEPPMPASFEGDADPQLEALSAPGLFRAPSIHPDLYYYEADDLWYRYWRRGWYQAFHWNGAWFPPRKVPGPLLDRTPPARDP